MKCHACERDAVLLVRVVPHSETRTLWDTTPRDVRACAAHIPDAKRIGTVIAATPLSDTVVTRVVQ